MPADDLPTRLARATDWVVDHAVLLVALWTLAFHSALVLGLTRDTTTVVWLVAGGLVVVLAGRRRAATTTEAESAVGTTPRRWPAAALVLIALATALAAGTWILDDRWWWALWSGAVVVSGGGAALALVGSKPRRAGPGLDARAVGTVGVVGVVVVVVIAGTFALLSAVTQRPDADDVFLLNRSVHVEQDAGEFPTRDTVFGDEVFRSLRPDGPQTSIEALVGVVARWSPFTSPTVAYLLLAPAVSALGVFALWRLVRTLRPTAATLATVVAAGYLFLDGSEHASFGNFTFARAWQGKVIFVFVVVPLLWHHAVRWSRDGDRWSLAMLVAGNVAGLGLTSTASFVAPAVTLLGAAAAHPGPTRRHWASLAATVYTVGGGVLGMVAAEQAPLADPGGELAAGAALAQVAGHQSTLDPAAQWYLVFGDGYGMFLGTAAALLAWLAVRRRSARLVLALAPLAVFLVFLTPGTLEAIDAYTGARSILWRSIWVVPVPAAVGLVLSAPVLLRSEPARRVLLVGVPVVALGGLLVFEQPVLSHDNRGLSVDGLAWDVDQGARSAADRLVALSREGDVVAAPEDIARVVAITTVEVRAVNPRLAFMTGAHAVPEFHGPERILVTDAVTRGIAAGERAGFREALATLSVDTVCTREVAEPTVAGELLESGYTPVATDESCTYWRPDTAAPLQDA